MTTISNAEMFEELKTTITGAIVKEINTLRLINDPQAITRTSTLLDIISTFATQEVISCFKLPNQDYANLETRINQMAEIITKDIINGVGQNVTENFIRELNWLAHLLAPQLNKDYVDVVFGCMAIDDVQEKFFGANESRLLKIIVIITHAIKTSTLFLELTLANSSVKGKNRDEKSKQ